MLLNPPPGPAIQNQKFDINRSLRMPLTRSAFLRAAVGALLSGACGPSPADDRSANFAALDRALVDTRLAVPHAETPRYGRLAEEALSRVGVALTEPQYVAGGVRAQRPAGMELGALAAGPKIYGAAIGLVRGQEMTERGIALPVMARCLS